MPGQLPEDHKLCGFFCSVLSIKTPDSNAILTPGAPCSLYASGNDAVGFRTESGIVLFPVASGSNPTASIAGEKKGTPEGECCNGSSSSSRKKRRKLGPGPGNFSVVPLVHTLVGNKCLEISACVIRVLSGVDGNDSGGDARAVVLVDVYLPIAVWSGWQFPKLRAGAAFLFRHLRHGACLPFSCSFFFLVFLIMY